ncbi:MAG TPA: M48 family metallopeptidase [Silvibacterium sp.]|nr:M48 family metallopeptidase [Silvibacterium sp.]
MFQPAIQSVYSLPPDKLAKAVALYHARTWAYFGDVAWTVVALWVLIRLRAGAAIRDLAARGSRRLWVQGIIAAPIWVLILIALGLPVALLMQHVDLVYGISVEPWSMWWADFGKSSGLTLVFGTIALSVLYALMRRSQARWWLWFWIITLPVEAAAIFLVPVLIDPMFDHFSPLAHADPALVLQLERVAARGHLHIPPSRMYVMDASAKVTGPNAYVTGYGASKRIVVWDTTLHELPQDEILATYGHEQGHYVLQHIPKGFLFSAAVMLIFFWIGYRVLLWAVRSFGGSWRIPSIEDWSSIGLLLLVLTVLSFFAEPVGNAFSRQIEHQADVYGEEVIHGLVPNPQATMAENFQHLGELWLDVPHPNRLLVFWTYSHPPTSDRMRFAANYDPWTQGKHPRYVSESREELPER